MARKVCPYNTESRQNAFEKARLFIFWDAHFRPNFYGRLVGMPGTFVSSIRRCFNLYYWRLGYSFKRSVFIEKESSIRGLRTYIRRRWRCSQAKALRHTRKMNIYDYIDELSFSPDFFECDTPEPFNNLKKQKALKKLVAQKTRCIWMCGSNRVGTFENEWVIKKIIGKKYILKTFCFSGMGANHLDKNGQNRGGAPMMLAVMVRK